MKKGYPGTNLSRKLRERIGTNFDGSRRRNRRGQSSRKESDHHLYHFEYRYHLKNHF